MRQCIGGILGCCASLLIATQVVLAQSAPLPPLQITTPFKLILFVLVDGWNLIVGSLVRSFY